MPLLAAVDRVLAGHHPPTWDGLAASLGEVTGRSWDGFLLTWVHSGTTPSLDVVWRHGDEGVRVEIGSDLPYGTFDVPVRVGAGKKAEVVAVRVEDGRGVLDLPWAGEALALRVDPKGILPVRGLEVRREGTMARGSR